MRCVTTLHYPLRQPWASLSSAMVGRYHYGEITEHPDWHRLAPELADMLARALAAAR